MELDTLTRAKTALANFESYLNGQIKAFNEIPNQYKDLVPGAKEKAMDSARKLQIESIRKTLNDKTPSTKREIQNIDSEISSLITPLRAANSAAGEAQFQSAISVVQSKNKKLIVSELEKAISSNRTDYAFSIYDQVAFSELDQQFKIQIDDLIRTHPSFRDYETLIQEKGFYSEILNMIDYQKRQLDSGTVNGNYSLNKAMRAKIVRK